MTRNPEISSFLRSRIEASDFPSAVYLVAEKGEIVFQDALGYAVVEPEQIEARLDTIYDLASLTKVVVAGVLLGIMCDRREISIDDPVAKYFEEFGGPDKSVVTLEQLLTHSGGFAAWLPFYLMSNKRADVIRTVAATTLEYIPGSKVVYSDPGYSILTFLIEQVFGKPISDIFGREVSTPLDIKKTFFNPPENFKHLTAASEIGNGFERQMCIELGYLQPPATASGTDKNAIVSVPGSERSSPFRKEVIWGEVHDGNAYFMGGVAGHAGLFSTAEEVFKIALQFLPKYTQLLKPETCELFRTNFTKGLNEDRSFAFQLASTKESTAGTKMSPESFGHTGFTGTSLWIDPTKDRIFILLTNRTHNHSLPFANINSVRRKFHDLAIDALDNK